MRMARVGILIDRKTAERRWEFGGNVFGKYLGEILSYAGIPFEFIADTTPVFDRLYDVVLVGLHAETKQTASALWSYMEKGGLVISYGGLNVLADTLGCIPSQHIPKGYAKISDKWGDTRPLRFFGAIPWVTQHREQTGVESGEIFKDHPAGEAAGAALRQFKVGEGWLDRWSVDIAHSIVCLQQGSRPVLEDGFPALDGTGPINEGILKAEDHMELDWKWDRLDTEEGFKYFAHPYADLWREALLTHLLKRVLQKRLTLPFVGYWPNNVKHVALISHDSDWSPDAAAETTLDMLEEFGIQSTWCMIKPGYSPYIYERVKTAGHELAFHYNAMDSQGGGWGYEQFQHQLEYVKSETDVESLTSSKNHYVRFEGWSELFDWCDACGIALDQSRGPSKMEGGGFLFGTCHPYHPISWFNERNRLYNVLELGFLTQDMRHKLHSGVITPLLDQVQRVDGIAHFLFHQIWLHTVEEARKSFRLTVDAAQKRGFEFWTSKQISDWVNVRMKVKIKGVNPDSSIEVAKPDQIGQVVVWLPITTEEPVADDLAKKLGVWCKKMVL